MNIRLAKTAGFCFGVKRAVDLAYSQKNTEKTYTFGPIIHNDSVINELIQKGIHPIETLEDQKINTLIIRSHGVMPEIYQAAQEQNINLIDATCPYVKKIHRVVKEYFDKDYKIIIIGNKDHPEVKGINGWADHQCIIVRDLEDFKATNPQKTNVSYLIVAQTTYKKEVVDRMVHYCKEEGYSYTYINTICNATKERQEEAITIAQQVDCMLIIGSSYSSNTLKLFEICEQYCKKSYCIATADALDDIMIKDCNEIGITAGASTPRSVIDEVIQKLIKMNP